MKAECRVPTEIIRFCKRGKECVKNCNSKLRKPSKDKLLKTNNKEQHPITGTEVELSPELVLSPLRQEGQLSIHPGPGPPE